MKKSVKSALLSALVFPGVGHFTLKKPVQGSALLGTASLCLYFLISTTVEVAQAISNKIQSGEVPIDLEKINELVAQQLASSGGQVADIATLVLIIVWVIGIVDSYRIGLSVDKSENEKAKTNTNTM